MENILYFPYINLPRVDWSARTLLYYDNIGSIVPQSYFNDPDSFEPFMRDMVRNELVIPINPIEVLSSPWEISKPFIKYINSKDFKLSRRKKSFVQKRHGRIHINDFYLEYHPKIHVDKFDAEIFYQLEQAGLAIRQDYNWFIVEKKTANELMMFLASVIGAKINYRPTTDEFEKKYVRQESKKHFETMKSENTKQDIILTNLIPFPEQIDLQKLRIFKDRHIELLKAFRNKVELIVLNETLKENSPIFLETIKELQCRKEELSAKMNEGKMGKIFLGTICGITGATIGLAAANSVGAVVGGLPGFTNAVYSALQMEKAEDIFDQSGMKYLALIDKRLRKPVLNKIA